MVTDEVTSKQSPFDLVPLTAEVVHLPESDVEVSLKTDEEGEVDLSLENRQFHYTSKATVASPVVVESDKNEESFTSELQKDSVALSKTESISGEKNGAENVSEKHLAVVEVEVKEGKESKDDETQKTSTNVPGSQVLCEQTITELTSTNTEKKCKSGVKDELSVQSKEITSADTIDSTSGQAAVFPEAAVSSISTTSELELTKSQHSVEQPETQSTETEHDSKQANDKLEKNTDLSSSVTEISTQPQHTSSTTLTITTFASSSTTSTPTIVAESTIETPGYSSSLTGGGGNLTESISTSSSSYYIEPRGSLTGSSLQRSAEEEFGGVGAEGDLLSSASSSSSPSWAAEGGGAEEKVNFGRESSGGDLRSTSSTTLTLTKEATDEVATQSPPPDTPTTLTTTTTMSFVLSGTSGGFGSSTGNGVGTFGPTDYNVTSSTPITSTTTTMTTTIYPASESMTRNGSATHSSPVITSSTTTSPRPSNANAFDVDRDWGQPLGLPSPVPPPGNASISAKLPPLPPQSGSGGSGLRSRPRTPDRRSSIGSNSTTTVGGATSNGLSRSNAHQHPVYVELAYVPGHGRRGYVDETFFQTVRARYYVFSGVTPSREVFEALLSAKATWDTPSNLYVTVIPTYESEALLSWIADNQRRLTELRIDVTPAANRCSINLADDGGATPTDESCSAYKVEL